HSRDHVAEFDLPPFVSKDRHVVWIPLHEGLAFANDPAGLRILFWALDLAAVRHGDDGTDDDIVALQFAALVVVYADRAVFVQHNPTSVECLHGPQIIELSRAVVLRLNDRLLKCLAGRATDVERAHR